LCDAVAALCGLRAEVRYEGQAAIELEACVDAAERAWYPFEVVEDSGMLVLDPCKTILAVAADIAAGVAAATVAARFHAGLARATAAVCALIARRERLDTVVLSGGVFQNRRLLEGVAGALEGEGLRVLVPERLPPNDGGIAYGQVAVAAARGG
jgi:hydrogenase maturation protein HypF